MDLPTITRLERPTDDAGVRHHARASAGSGALLAGGTWLFSAPQTHLDTLVDLTAAGWPALAITDAGLSVAATATLAELSAVTTPADWTAASLLRDAPDALVGARAVQAQATVGGNLALALPAGPITLLAAVLDAAVVLWPAAPARGVGGETTETETETETERRVPVTDLVVGAGVTTLAPGDVIRSLEVPVHALRARAAIRKVSRTPRGRSAALLAGRRDADGAVTLAVTAALDRPAVLRWPDLPTAGEMDAAVDALGDGPAAWFDDPHGSPDWRRALSRVLAGEIRGELA